MTTRRIPRPDVSKPAPVAAGTVRRVAVTVGGVQAPGSPITHEGTIDIPAGGGPHTHPSSDVTVDRVAGSTYSTLQHYINTMTSPGIVTGGLISKSSATEVTVSAGTAMLRVADDDVSSLVMCDFAAATFVVPNDDAVRFFGLNYNAGVPIVEMRTTYNWDKDTEIPLGAALRNAAGTIFVAATNQFKTGDPITNIIQRFDSIAPVQRDLGVGGLKISETGTRNIAITAGKLWIRLNDLDFAAFDTSVSGSWVVAYYNGTAWVQSNGVTQWPNTQYNDVATGLVDLTNNYYANLWFYVGADATSVWMLYGQQQYNKLSDAENEGEPTFFPPNEREFLTLVGRLTFQKGAATAAALVSPFDTLLPLGAPVNAHNDLTGLQGGTTGEYYHLTAAERSTVQDPIIAALAALANAPGVLTNDGAGVLSWGAGGGGGGGSGGTAENFTPTVTFATPGNLSVAYTTRIGKYVRIGDKVFVDITLDFTPTHTTASGNFRITGLPFNVASSEPRYVGSLVMAYAFTQPTSSKHHFSIAIEGTDYIQLGVSADGTSGSSTFTTAQFVTGANRFLRISLAYTATHDAAYGQADVRERLLANRDYYVRTDGNDSNTGLVDSAAGAFLTTQKAVDVVAGDLDLGPYSVTIHVGDGTYTAETILKSYVGAGPVTIQGNSATPTNVHLNPSSMPGGGIIKASAVLGKWILKDFKLSSAVNGFGILAEQGSAIEYSGLDFGSLATGYAQIMLQSGARVTCTGPYTISAGVTSGRHIYSQMSSVFAFSTTGTITLSGTPAYGIFALADRAGEIIAALVPTWSGAATGQRYYAALNSVIYSGGSGANWFPGNAAGATVTGGQYG